VAIFSYDGGLTFGVTGDYDEAPDIDVLCRGIEESMRELVEAAVRESHVEAPGRKARKRAGQRARDGQARNGSLPRALTGEPPTR
jgi:hypothetical protein